MSLYQMWQMDRIPDHALVNDAVELAKHELGKGIDRYLNGVLRGLTRSRPWKGEAFLRGAPLWVQVSLPKWLWDRWVERYGTDSARDFALSLNRPPQAAFRGAGEAAESGAVPSDLVPDAFIRTKAVGGRGADEDEASLFPFQDEASQLIPHLLGSSASGWRIWDACAAPGGKCAILCKICGESGRVIASDLSRERLSRLIKFFEGRAGLKPDVILADASQPAPFRVFFDAILADAPCSGLGTLRRNPEIKWHFQPGQFASLQRAQNRILASASEAVRVGGRLLYCTCSTEPEENEQVVESFLRSHPRFSLEQPVFPPGIQAWTCRDQMVRTFPGTRLWDGFFAALLVRRS
jgi:16S rRNA (cytosine967-C5)-methyltransferase